MAQKRIKFGIDFETNSRGIRQAYSELEKLANINLEGLSKGLKEPEKELENVQKMAKGVKEALQNSFNVELGTTNFTKFNAELKRLNISAKQIGPELAKGGAQGAAAMSAVSAALNTTNTELRQTNKLAEQMWDTFANAAKWSVAYGAIHKIADAIRDSYSFTKDLDESLNDIRIVTNKSADDMAQFARQANAAAAALGKTTKDYTTASLLFYQQGLSDKEVAARTDVTLKAANVTGQSAQEVSQQLTAVWNGYKVSAEEAELYIDKVAAVAATTASNLQELSEGMSKVASAANTMGVDIDQLNAQLSTIISVTRQDAATAGTALKTIYARMTDIESGLDTETTLGEYTSKMAQFGIQVLDSKGALRDVGDVMDEIGGKWDTFTKTQQVALAQAMAGTRQYNNLMALFGNWDKYTESLKTSQEAVGTLQSQQNTSMESLQAHLNQLTASKEKLYDSLFDSKSFKSIIDTLSSFIDKLSFFFDSIGGIGPALTSLGAILLTVFNQQITASLSATINNLKDLKEKTQENKEALKFLKEYAEGTEDEYEKARAQAAILRRNGIISEEDKQATDEGIDQLESYRKELKEVQNTIEELKKKKEALLSGGQEKKDFLNLMPKDYSFETPDDTALKKVETRLKGAEEGADSFQGSLEKLTKFLNENQTPFSTNGLVDQEKIDEKTKLLDRQKILVEEVNQKYQTLSRSVETYINLLDNLEEKTYDENGQEIESDEIKKLKELRENVKQARDNIVEDSQGAKRIETENINSLNVAFSQLEEHLGNIDDRTKSAIAAGKEVLDGTVEGKIEDINQQLETENNKVGKLTQNVENASEALGKINKKADLTQTISQFTQLASKTMILVSAFNTLGNIKNIWNNKNLSGGEKFKQTLMAITSAATMLSPMLIKVISHIKAYNTVRASSLILDSKQATETLKYNAALAASTILEDKNVKKKIAGLGVDIIKLKTDEAYIDTLDDEVKIKLQSIFVEKLGTAAKTAGIGATFAQTVAEKGFVAAIWEEVTALWAKVAAQIAANWQLALAVAIIAAAVAAIILMTKAIQQATDRLNKNTKAVEKSSEALKYQTELYNEAREAYDNLKSSVEDYKGMQDAINNMTVGTLEWKEAIQDANEKVLDLIDAYPELADAVTTSSVAGITQLLLDEGALNAALEKALADRNKKYSQKLQAQIDLRDAKQHLNMEDYNKQMDYQQGVGAAITSGMFNLLGDNVGAVASAFMEKDWKNALGDPKVWASLFGLGGVTQGIENLSKGDWLVGLAQILLPGIGSFVETINVAAARQEDGTKKVEDAVQILADRYLAIGENALLKENVEATLRSAGVEESLISHLTNNMAALRENTIAIANNTQAKAIENQQIMDSYLASRDKNYAYEEVKAVKNATMVASGVFYDQELETAKARWDDSGKITDEEAQKKYAELMGYKWIANKGNNTGTYAKQDENGEWKEFDLSDLIAREANAVEEAKQNAAARTKNVKTKELYKAVKDRSGEETAQAILGLAGGKQTTSLTNLTRSKFNELNSIDFTKIDEVTKAFGLSEKELKEQLEALGLSFEEFGKAMEESSDLAREAWKKAAERIEDEKAREIFENLQNNALENTSLEVQDAISKALAKAPELAGTLADMLNGAPEGMVDEIAKAFSQVNWEDIDGINQFNNALTKLGVTIKDGELNNKIQATAKALQDALSDPSVWDASKVKNFTSAVKEFLNAITGKFDIIDQSKYDQYKKIFEKEGIKDYFVDIGNGQYQQRVSSAEFEDALKNRYNTLGNFSFSSLEKDYNDRITKRNDALPKINNKIYEPYLSLAKESDANDNGEYEITESDREAYELAKDQMDSSTRKYIEGQLNGEVFQNYASYQYFRNEINRILVSQNEDYQTAKETLNETLDKKIEDNDIEIMKDRLANDPWIDDKTLKEYQKIINWLDDDDSRKPELQNLHDNAVASAQLQKAQTQRLKRINDIATKEEGINKILDARSKTLDKLKKQRELMAMSAADESKNLNAQLDNLKAQVKNTETLKEIQSRKIAVDRQNYAELRNKSNVLQAYDALTVDNYAQQLLKVSDYLAKEYGSSSAAYTQYYEEAEELFQKKIEALLKGEEYDAQILDTISNTVALEIEQLYNVSKKWESLISAQKELNSAMQKLAEIYKDYAKLANVYTKSYALGKDSYEHYSTAANAKANRIVELKGKKALTKEDAIELQQLQESIISDIKNATSAITEMQSAFQSLEKERLELGQKINEQYETQIKNAETLVALMNHQIKMQKMLGGEKNYKENNLSEQYAKIFAQRNTQLSLNVDKFNTAVATYKAYEGSAASDETIQKALNDIGEMGKATLSAIESTLDAAKDLFETKVMEAFDAVVEGISIAQMQREADQYNWQYEFDQNYMKNMTRDLNIANIGIKYQKAINSYAGNEAAQKRMVAAYQEVNKLLKEKELLTKNDIALAEKRLALEQARIDLENAQRDTSKLRLVRGANGEYSYQYVADQSAILDKQEAYNKAQLDYNAQEAQIVKDIVAEGSKLVALMEEYSKEIEPEKREQLWERIVTTIGGLSSSIIGADLELLPAPLKDWIVTWSNMKKDDLAPLETTLKNTNGQFEKAKESLASFIGENGLLTKFAGYIGDSNTNAQNLAESLNNMKIILGDKDNGVIGGLREMKETIESFVDALAGTDGEDGKEGKEGLINRIMDLLNEDNNPTPVLGAAFEVKKGTSTSSKYYDYEKDKNLSRLETEGNQLILNKPSQEGVDAVWGEIEKTITTLYKNLGIKDQNTIDNVISDVKNNVDAHANTNNTFVIDLPNITEITELADAFIHGPIGYGYYYTDK